MPKELLEKGRKEVEIEQVKTEPIKKKGWSDASVSDKEHGQLDESGRYRWNAKSKSFLPRRSESPSPCRRGVWTNDEEMPEKEQKDDGEHDKEKPEMIEEDDSDNPELTKNRMNVSERASSN